MRRDLGKGSGRRGGRGSGRGRRSRMREGRRLRIRRGGGLGGRGLRRESVCRGGEMMTRRIEKKWACWWDLRRRDGGDGAC